MSAERGRRFETAIIGGGPAAMQLFIAADKEGTLDAFLDKGAVLLDRDTQIGDGGFRDRYISSNTNAVDLLTDIAIFGRYEHVVDGGPALHLRTAGHAYASLADSFAPFFRDLGDRTKAFLDEHPHSATHTGTNVEKVVQTADGELVQAVHVIFATGVEEQLHPDLAEYKERVVFSSELIASPDLAQTHPAFMNGQNIAIVGGSHSAWSTAHKIGERKEGKLTVVHRSPVVIDYGGMQAEIRLGCIKGEARDFYQHVKAGEIRSASLQQADTLLAATDILDTADVIVQATGYVTRVVPVFDRQGKQLAPKMSADGQVDQSSRSKLRDYAGNVIPGLYGVGHGYSATLSGVRWDTLYQYMQAGGTTVREIISQ